jgi:hypothetical protein
VKEVVVAKLNILFWHMLGGLSKTSYQDSQSEG